MKIVHGINDLCKIVHHTQLRQNYKQYYKVGSLW